jgi:predicted aconitase with swiveling domain
MRVVLTGRAIKAGHASAMALFSPEPISFYGGVDPDSGIVVERGHPLEGQCIAGKALVFPRGKGSTVGSYIIYRLKRRNLAPAAMVLAECEPIVALGAIMAEIPTVDKVRIEAIPTGSFVTVCGEEVIIE